MKIEIPDCKKLVHETRTPVRWGDMDVMGHVNNAVYFRYMEIVRIEWMVKVGCVSTPGSPGPIVVNTFCNFYRQFEYPCDVLLKFYVSDPGRTTFDSWVTMERSDRPGEIAAAGGATVIWVDPVLQKAVELPQWVREIVTL